MNVKVHILKLRVQRRPFAHLHILTFAHSPCICTFTKHLHIYKTSLTLSASKANCFCKASMLLKRRSSRMRR